MCDRTHVRSIYPHGGPASGGTRVWLSGSLFNERSAASVTFSFGPELQLRSTNATLITRDGLAAVVTPHVPASAGALPPHAQAQADYDAYYAAYYAAASASAPFCGSAASASAPICGSAASASAPI